jgi:hypothetical protein
MAQRIVTRKGDVAKRKAAQSSLMEIAEVRKTFNQRKKKADGQYDAWDMEKKKTERAREALEDAEANLAAAQEVIDEDYLPEGAQPPARIHKRDQLALIVAQLQAALEAQKRSQSAAFDANMVAERLVFESAQDLHKRLDTLEDAEVAVKINQELDQVRADGLRRVEIARAKSWETEQTLAIDARAAQVQELTLLAARQVEAAKTSHKGAVHRVLDAGKNRDIVLDNIMATEDAYQLDRQTAVLELKANSDVARLQAAKQSDRKVKKQERAAQQLQDEKETLLSKGINPYVEFRQREFDAEAKQRKQALNDAVVQNKVNLANRLITEETEGFKDDAADAKARFYEKKHRDAQGRQVTEEKVTHYITSVMSGGHEVLDPSGRAPRIDPSQVTNIPDRSFGLGKSSRIPAPSMKRITENIRKALQVDEADLGEYQRLVTGLLSAEEKEQLAAEKAAKGRSNGTASRPMTGSGLTPEEKKAVQAENTRKQQEAAVLATLTSLAPETGKMPGTTLAATTVNLEDDEEEKGLLLKIAELDAGGAVASQSLVSLSPKYTIAKQSTFEVKSLERAKEAQRQRLEEGTVQIAGGKEFKGQSFVPSPAELKFVDFVVGQVYTLVFTLTNASYTFNSFKILPLEDGIVDFFDVTFEKPGRMSAGVSCPLTIQFKPEENRDIRSFLRFNTQTGPVAVPIVCLIKRCAPRITTPLIDFGNMIIGQTSSMKLEFNNTQAIGTDFVVTYVDEKGEPMSLAAAARPVTAATTAGAAEGGVGTAPATEEEDAPLDHSIPAESVLELDQRVRRTASKVLRAKKAANPLPISLKTMTHKVDGYGVASVDVNCASLSVGSVTQRFCVEFLGVKDADKSVDDQGEAVKRLQYFTVTVKGDEVPIYLAEETLDLRCCLYGRTYRQRIQLCNRSKNAYKVGITIKAPFNKYVEANPDVCFVQGNGSQFINIKYTPKVDLLTDLGYYSLPEAGFANSALMCLPIQIDVTNQDLPVFFNVRSHITPSTIETSVSRMDFGTVYVNQSSTVVLTLKNTSMLPQKVAFVRLKKEITVQPNDGFATLLPNESLDFEISFCPNMALAYSFDLAIMTSNNDTYKIRVVGNGVEPPISMSSSVITMRTTGPGERVIESCTFTNTTAEQQVAEICIPDSRFTWLKVSPSILCLEPGASARVECEFCPPRDANTLDPEEWLRKQQAAISKEGGPADSPLTHPFDSFEAASGWMWGKGMFGELQWTKAGAGTGPGSSPSGGAKEGSSSAGGENAPAAEEKGEEKRKQAFEPFVAADLPANEWGVAGRWTLPVCILDPAAKKGGSSAAGGKSNSKSPMFLCVNTMTTLPQLVADPNGLDFGQLSLGTRVLKGFKIQNRGHQAVNLSCNGVNAVGCFTIIRPPKSIGPGEVRLIMIECLLKRPGMNVDMLEITNDSAAGGHALRIELRAHGLKPLISLGKLLPPPANWNSRCGLLNFANVVVSDSVKQSFSVLNSSSFAVNVTILRSAGKGLSPAKQAELVERTSTGQPVISFLPEQFNVGPGESMDVTVIFSCDYARFRPFREDLEVVVGQTDEVLKIGIVGTSRARQMCVLTGNPEDEPFNRVMQPGGAGVYPAHDPLARHFNKEVRDLDALTKAALSLAPTLEPPIKLEYPNPFSPDADPASFTEGAPAPAGKAAKGAPPPTEGKVTRSQVRRLLITSAAISDGRAGAGNGTFEVKMSPEMAASGYFTLSTDKGAVNAGASTPVDITCTLPQPKGLGGLSAGSWKSYSATVVLLGGWAQEGDAPSKEVPVVLQAFIGL